MWEILIGLSAIALYMMIIFKSRKEDLNKKFVVEPFDFAGYANYHQLYVAINDSRREHNLNDLLLEYTISRMADRRCAEMIEVGELSHKLAADEFAGLMYLGLDTVGENTAYGYKTIPALMQAWLNSPGHRKNLLNPNWDLLGIAIQIDSKGNPYYCTIFGNDKVFEF